VDKLCYDFARFGRQKVVVISKYGHDPLVVTLYELRDHERVARPKTSRGMGGTGWPGVLRDVSALLREFTADLR
jgi:hypothetical protein